MLQERRSYVVTVEVVLATVKSAFADVDITGNSITETVRP